MESVGVIIVVAALAQTLFLMLAAGLWWIRPKAINSWRSFPLAFGAIAATVSLLFPISELAFNIGPRYMPTCLTYSECSDAVISSVIWILCSSAVLIMQIFLYRRSAD